MWLPSRITWPLEALSDLQRDMFHLKLAVLAIPTRLIKIERLIMTSADNLATRIDAATNDLAADLTAIRDALAAALANTDAATQAAVNAELAKLDAPIARLEALGADPADPIPAADDAPADEPAPPADAAPADEPPADQPA